MQKNNECFLRKNCTQADGHMGKGKITEISNENGGPKILPVFFNSSVEGCRSGHSILWHFFFCNNQSLQTGAVKLLLWWYGQG